VVVVHQQTGEGDQRGLVHLSVWHRSGNYYPLRRRRRRSNCGRETRQHRSWKCHGMVLVPLDTIICRKNASFSKGGKRKGPEFFEKKKKRKRKKEKRKIKRKRKRKRKKKKKNEPTCWPDGLQQHPIEPRWDRHGD